MKPLVSWFKALTVAGKAGVIIAAFVGLSVVSAATQSPNNQPSTTKPAPSSGSSMPSKPLITTKTVTETKPVPFTSSTVQDGTIAQGTSSITTKGADGIETLTYQDTYTDGKLTDHKLVSDEVTTKPVAQVTTVGTYVAPASTTPTCTNGTYVNSAGNTVCSPEQSSTQPAGATAQCVDGSYSFSQSRSGTCSHHGGVATWLN